MRILYGVQGTGNGHLTRARCMAKAFTDRDVQVDYVFSGREAAAYFDMDCFGSATFYRGLTFAIHNHKISRWRTLKINNPLRFLDEVREIKSTEYDLVISDYEPLTAWSATWHKVPLLGLAHQYSFKSKAPRPGNDPISTLLLKYFAPARHSLGMHWHHFGGDVLPPMVEVELERLPASKPFTLVYLPFEEPERVIQVLKQVDNHYFHFYSPKVKTCSRHRNVTVHPVSRDAFRSHLVSTSQIICSAGFELISEALYLGIPVMAIPLAGQIEQLGNAMALEQLQLAKIARELNAPELKDFLHSPPRCQPQRYPDVAGAVADYCLGFNESDHSSIVRPLWQQVGNLQPSFRSC